MEIITQASPKGVQFIRGHESPGGRPVLRAYRCPAGVITIGDGFTMRSRIFADYWRGKHGRALQMGDTITVAECDMLLKKMIDEEYGAPVATKVRPRKQHQFDGSASMSWNCGPGALDWRWAQALARGAVSEAARLLRVTATTANGRELAGLKRRRGEEADLIEHARYGKLKGSVAAVSTSKDEVAEYQGWLEKLGYDIGPAGPWLRGADPDTFDPARDGVAMMECQRRNLDVFSSRRPDSLLGHGIGGFCQMTTVTRDGVTSQILRAWPDQVGERIDPFRDDAAVA